MDKNNKQYGLIDPKKYKVKPDLPAPKPSIFDDSDSDSNDKQLPVNKPTTHQTRLRYQDKIAQQKALSEDPTVYQYDEIYDDMVNERKESKLARKDIDKKPKYIAKLMQTAEKRKRENERRIERQVQKERDEEGDEFRDKESFVTTAYKKKLEEMKELEEQEKREEYLETIGDVRKQQDLGGFYRHLYEQKVKSDDSDDDKKRQAFVKGKRNSESLEQSESSVKTSNAKTKLKREYRKRKSSKSDSDNETENNETHQKASHLPSNIDADSDFSIDSESEGENETRREEIETEVSVKKEPVENEPESVNSDVKKCNIKPVEDDKPLEFEPAEPEIKEEPVEKKPKIDIWKKRTVGIVFDEALERYFKRKAARSSTG